MDRICLIPIRSGSKGLKDKNIAFLGEYPLAVYTIDAAIKSNLFKESNIYISTDSAEYIEVLKSYRPNISYIKRQESLATDKTTSQEVIVDFLSKVEGDFIFFLLQATSPLRNFIDLQKAFEKFDKNKLYPVVSITKSGKSIDLFSELYPQDKLKGIVGIDIGYRRQDKKEVYTPNGAIYITSKDNYLKDRSFYTEETIGYVMSEKNSIDIDTIDDYLQANAMIKKELNRPIDLLEDRSVIFLSDGRYMQNFINAINISQSNVNIIEYLKTLKDIGKKVIMSVGNNIEENHISLLKEVLINLDIKDVMLLSVLNFKYRPDLDKDVSKVNKMLKDVSKIKGYEFIDLNKQINKIEFYLDGYHLNEQGEKFLENILEKKW